ncbi:hypothetical protein SAMN02745121_02714 [Nannocystis exedens]|uniref:Uncharacterized protein n=1 Tax=Nannocystis exedens TaxID=54 RepID=A0A1I1X9K8_9BACT|nr:hypothetical protein [Nannocystis exedens]PCC70820.1 hypothetical protein NAEX_03884 [Nannocystis exedens]SFE02050.1 hypothetical protein SAMN02745121_02714 [Nannocystis exedens]
MTGSDPSASSPKPEIGRAAVRGVLDPAWEDELRRGQEAEGETGSIEGELAIVRLLRHARAPEALTAGELDKLWSGELAPALTPAPWWRRRWLWGAVPAVATAAVVLLVVRGPESASAPQVATAESAAAPAAAAPGPSASKLLAQQFAQLEHDARRDLDARVDDDRGVLRHDLLAMSLGDKP